MVLACVAGVVVQVAAVAVPVVWCCCPRSKMRACNRHRAASNFGAPSRVPVVEVGGGCCSGGTGWL